MGWTHEDPVIEEILGDYRRAGASLLGAAGLGILWFAMIVATVLLPERGWVVGVATGLTSPMGWGALAMLGLSLLQYGHAWLHLRALAENPADEQRRRGD
jgi:hypothetical protein